MKKVFLVALFLCFNVLSSFSVSNSQFKTKESISVSTDRYFLSGGIWYVAYLDSSNNITSVTAASGTVYSYTGFVFTATHGNPGSPVTPGTECINIQMDTSNGYIDYNGVLFH